MTTFSPCETGSVEIRKSMGVVFTTTRARPSWGRNRSAMSNEPMILRREINGTPAARGIFMICLQHTVDTVANRDAAFLGLDVNVTCPRQDAFRQDEVYHPHDGSLRRLRLGDDHVLRFRLLIDGCDINIRIAHAIENPLHHVLGAIQFVEVLGDDHRAGQQEPHLPSRRKGQGLFTIEVERIGGGDLEVRIGGTHRKDVVLACLRLGDEVLRRRFHLRDVRDFYPELRGEGAQDLSVGCDLAGDRSLPQRRRHIVTLLELLEFVLANELG